MRILSSLLISILIMGPVWAAPPRQLPAGSQVEVGGNHLRAYTLEEFKIVLHIYADYMNWHTQVPKLTDQATKLSQLVENQNQQLKLRAGEVKILGEERDRLTKKWTEENRLRHLCENKPAFGSWIAWSAAGAMSLVATVLSIILIVDD